MFAAAYDAVSGEPLYDVRVCGSEAGTTVRAHRLEIFRAEVLYFDDGDLLTFGRSHRGVGSLPSSGPQGSRFSGRDQRRAAAGDGASLRRVARRST
ncbi:hypothetical protein [Kribbella qitaiheensis]|uniref:hypothetical protein n=1 Tax=Kribbella qitaiheensis TaxID=1544730 RepID=UPI001FEC9B46|nr:hypothetical protein [Kribbella qitaiheensis]